MEINSRVQKKNRKEKWSRKSCQVLSQCIYTYCYHENLLVDVGDFLVCVSGFLVGVGGFLICRCDFLVGAPAENETEAIELVV